MKKNIFLVILIFVTVGCDNKNVSLNEMVYNKFEHNKNLSTAEKAYAARAYELMIKLKDSSAIPLNVDEFFASSSQYFLESDVYKKWGLGDKKEFSTNEKLYIIKLPEIARIWQDYKSIDLNNLTEDENKFLKKVHNRYGPGPICLREEFKKEHGKLLPDQENLFDLVSSPTGHTCFNDTDLIFYYKMLPK